MDKLKLQQVPINHSQLSQLFDFVRKDFPFMTHIPFFIIRRAMKRGVLHGVYLTDGEIVYGYAIYQVEPLLNMMHVLYLAIRAEYRSLGLGGALMGRLQELAKNGLLLEVEDPEAAKDYEEITVRTRRISFYERNGLALQSESRLSHFGYPILIMTNKTSTGMDWLSYSRQLYNRAYGFPLANFVIKTRN
ncbi:GNAT family N-acetyltransferase [Paenibacillus turpanensis]|uniref:GNAT family N-acetyltransferase n=1 Tax=Paenibacillus turpanensis TaxID=2689078 RepID=UPI00140CB5B1|nr:GNAT family N-acetyltransferase [Paenibacillus turpanensis]